MKKTIYLVIVLAFCFSILNSREITIEKNYGDNILECSIKNNNLLSIDFSLKSYEIEDVQKNGLEFKKLSVPNEGVTLEKGLPELPKIARLIGIENEGNPYVNLISYEKEVIKNITVFPNQTTAFEEKSDFDIDNEFYSNGKIYPKEIVRIGKPAILRDYRVASLIMYPFQFDPIKKELTIYSNIEFEILYNFEEETINPKQGNRPTSKAFESIYSSSILNYDIVNNNRSGEYQKPCLLIIRREAIQVQESWLSDFIDWKHRKGFEVVSIDAETVIGPIYGGITFTEIKAYIVDAYENWDNPPEYICLIGDGSFNSSYSIPPGFINNNESDQLYVLMSDDYLPDIMIGRLPFSNNISDNRTIINKIIDYETERNTTDTWIENVLLVSDPYYDDRSYVHSKITTNQYIQSIIPNENSNYNIDFLIDPSLNQLWWEFEYGISFFNYMGDNHFSNININWINSLGNGDMLPFISAITCDTGQYGDDGFGPLFLTAGHPTHPEGAIAFIGSSSGGTITVYNNHLSAGISSGIFNDQVYSFGGALLKGQVALQTAFPTNPAYLTDTILWNNLFGDPTIELWTDVPMEMIVDDYPLTKTLGDNYIEFNITNSNIEPLDSVLVCLLKQTVTGDDEIFETYYTDENGDVQIPYIAFTTGVVLVTATKHNYTPHLGNFTIVEEEFSVNFNSLVIDDDNSGNSIGNGDGLANPGEQIELVIILKNFGSVTAENITAEISTEHPNISVINGSASYGNIAPGEIAAPGDYFVVSIGLNCPDENANLDIVIQDDNNHTYYGIVVLPITGYETEFVEINNNVFPNGTHDITISLQNTGEITTPGFFTKLIGNYDDLIIEDEYGNYSPIEPGLTGVTNDYYTITANESIIPGAVFNLTLEIYVDLTYQTLFKSLSIPLVVGIPDVDDPLGPDTYGYLCYDDGDIGYDDVPVYEWIEINVIGTPLTEINQEPGPNDLGAYNQAINLPFNFSFYGIEYDNKLTVSSAGFISFGDQDEAAFFNSPLPGPLGPSPMIAAFWDEMDYIEGTSNASYFYDDMYHRFIIEWNYFANSYNTLAQETFQVILFDPAYYPTLSSDGLIKMQYKHINNDDVLFCYSSIGLEDHTQSIGLQYTYFNIYPDAAKELENEMAIFFTTGKNRQEGTMNIPAGQTVELDHLYIENGLYNDVYGSLIVNDGLQINSNSTLRIYGTLILENSNLFVLEGSHIELYGTLDLRDGSSVEFIENSSFLVEAGATILGNTTSGDRIIIQDGSDFSINGSPEERVTITSSNPPTFWKGITFKNYYEDDILIENCDFSYTSQLEFSDDDADMQVKMKNCNFTNSGVILVRELASFELIGENEFRCDISQNIGAPIFTFSTNCLIENCDIHNNGGGLAMYYPSLQGQSEIKNTDIYENICFGVHLYQASVIFDNCLIELNRYHGFMADHNAVSKLKDCTIQNNGNPLPGYLNNGVEIMAAYDSFPYMHKDDPVNYTQGMNTIYDEVDGGYTDHFLLWVSGFEPGMRQIPMWGNFFLNSNDPGYTERFYPEYNTFNFSEVPHDPRTAYDTAQSKIIAGDYEEAKIDLKNLISDYPEEDYYVSCSLNWLLFLEKFAGNDFTELRNYIEGLSLPASQEQVMYNVISQTYAQDQDYTEVLPRCEFIINDPPTPEELIYATIDEGYYYLKALEQNQSGRGLPVCSVKLKDFTEFMEMLRELELELHDILSPEDPPLIKLRANNYPNPFNPETTISFDLPQDSKVNISIYNIKGQKIKTLLAGNFEKGTQSVIWNGMDSNNKPIASGIYFYKLSAGKETAIKKMLLLK